MSQLVSVLNWQEIAGLVGSGGAAGAGGTSKVEATLMEITTVSGGVAVSTAPLSVSQYAHACIFIDHAYLDTGASGTIGVEYTIQTAQKSAGNDNWRNYALYRTALLTPSFAVTPVSGNLPGETTISLANQGPGNGGGASGMTATDRVFFQNNVTFGNSEWADVVRSSQTTFVLLRDGLTYTQESSYLFSKSEQYVVNMRLDDVERLRVTVNNALYTNTNKLIAFRARAILGNA